MIPWSPFSDSILTLFLSSANISLEARNITLNPSSHISQVREGGVEMEANGGGRGGRAATRMRGEKDLILLLN